MEIRKQEYGLGTEFQSKAIAQAAVGAKHRALQQRR